ncbi:hypothetical protein [Hymenobacter elongatus]|uniref:Lipoprotein n=1 Tax=Hymenobacter elongatus TaxID=877208 RepID=A0A4Z0PGL1_9BACT|nr:hypothetical protein [Hymenobacter elongatus]TGE14275.1 hypothetical protein E5J99_16815 [Hymenobacter elongatus]
MTKTLLLSALAVASLALNACSGEPSDLRPEAKVSVDLVAPGARSTENFDHGTAHEAHQAKGGAIAEPISSGTNYEKDRHPVAEEAMSANSEQALRTKKKSDAAKIGASVPQDNTEKPAEKMKEE